MRSSPLFMSRGESASGSTNCRIRFRFFFPPSFVTTSTSKTFLPPPPLSGSRLFSSWPLFVPRDEKMIKGKKIKKGERTEIPFCRYFS